jgi:translation elongation factor EF-G
MLKSFSVRRKLEGSSTPLPATSAGPSGAVTPAATRTQQNGEFDAHVETGFQISTFQGPLCAEPMEGMAFFIERLDVEREGLEREIGSSYHVHKERQITNSRKLHRAEQDGTGYRLTHLCGQGRVPRWAAGLEPPVDACHVFV